MVRYRVSDIRRLVDLQSGHQVRLVPAYADDKVLSRKEAACYLAIPESTIATWRTRQPGYGPPQFKLGARAMYRLSDLNRWIDDHLEPMDT
jgi:predicted DNA-binding transcriptional regulator AlpA